jgi:hypothetical protein
MKQGHPIHQVLIPQQFSCEATSQTLLLPFLWADQMRGQGWDL